MLNKNDKKIEDIVCSNRRNQEELDQMEQDNSAQNVVQAYRGEMQNFVEGVNLRAVNAHESIQRRLEKKRGAVNREQFFKARSGLRKLVPLDTDVTENQKIDEVQIAANPLPPVKNHHSGGSLSLDY